MVDAGDVNFLNGQLVNDYLELVAADPVGPQSHFLFILVKWHIIQAKLKVSI